MVVCRSVFEPGNGGLQASLLNLVMVVCRPVFEPGNGSLQASV